MAEGSAKDVTIAVVCAAWRTGRQVERHALGDGNGARTLARDPGRMDTEDDGPARDLETVEGPRATVSGAARVTCCAGGPFGNEAVQEV